MFLIPLNQVESVELVVHALKIAGGDADCSTCPASKVCMKQCLTIAEAVEQMLADGQLPTVGEPETEEEQTLNKAEPSPSESAPTTKPSLKVVK